MIEIKLIVPSSKEECNVSDCSVCDLDILTCGDCEKIWKIGMNKMNNIESTKKLEDFPFVTAGPIKITPLSPLPHTIFVPRLFRDGDMWCALYGEDIMEGIVGFGKSPDKAVKCFDDAFYEDIVNNKIIEEPTELEFHVAARKYLEKKIEDVFNLDPKELFTFHDKKRSDIQRISDDEGIIYNFDSKGKKISLKEMIKKCEKKSFLSRK